MRIIFKLLSIIILSVSIFSMSSCGDNNNNNNAPEESIDYNQYIGTYNLYYASIGDMNVTHTYVYYRLELKEYRQAVTTYLHAGEGQKVQTEEGVYSIKDNKIYIRINYNGAYKEEYYDIVNGELHMTSNYQGVSFVIKLAK